MKYKHILWNNEGNHDKIWGVLEFESESRFTITCVIFWGRRGKKIQSKIKRDMDRYSIEKTYREKLSKGYEDVDRNKLDEVYPNFEEDLDVLSFISALRV